jgi:hypothetical protein
MSDRVRRNPTAGRARHGAVAFAAIVAALGVWGADYEADAPEVIAAFENSKPPPRPEPEPIEVSVGEDPPPDTESPTVVASARLLAAGARALEEEGSLPPLLMDYDAVGFAHYVELLRGLGATAVVISGDADVVGEIDLTSGEISAFRAERPYSPRGRDYSDEPEVARTIARARRELDDESVTILVAVPADVDALLLGALIVKLESLGLEPGGFREFTGRYEQADGAGLVAHIEHGITHDGRRHELGVRVDIGSPAHTSQVSGRGFARS